MSESQVDFKVGDVVKIKAGTEHYGQDRSYNPADVLGVVVNVKTPDEEGYKYDVRWNTNCSNVYRPKDLELVVSAVQPTKDGTQSDSSELEEALAHIESLESALEDAVRELISLREGNSSAVIDVDDSEFKPINEMTLEDWELAKEERWVFELNNGTEVFVQGIMDEFNDEVHPVELNDLDDSHECTVTVQGCYHSGNSEHERSIKKRIK